MSANTTATSDLSTRVFESVRFDETGAEIVDFTATWAEMEADNEPETMDEIAEIPLGEMRTLGQCDNLRRIA